MGHTSKSPCPFCQHVTGVVQGTRITLRGTIEIESFAKGSKSEHEGFLFTSDTGKLYEIRMSQNDNDLFPNVRKHKIRAFVGKQIEATGTVFGNKFLADSVTEIVS